MRWQQKLPLVTSRSLSSERIRQCNFHLWFVPCLLSVSATRRCLWLCRYLVVNTRESWPPPPCQGLRWEIEAAQAWVWWRRKPCSPAPVTGESECHTHPLQGQEQKGRKEQMLQWCGRHSARAQWIGSCAKFWPAEWISISRTGFLCILPQPKMWLPP